MARRKHQRPRKTEIPNRRQSRSRLVIVIGVLAVALVGAIAFAFSASQGQQVSGTAGPRDAALIAQGRALYATHCALCHGADLKGTSTGPPFLHVTYAPNHHGDESFQRAVAAGVTAHHWSFGDMPPLAHLTRDEVNAVVAFIRGQQRLNGILVDPSH